MSKSLGNVIDMNAIVYGGTVRLFLFLLSIFACPFLYFLETLFETLINNGHFIN